MPRLVVTGKEQSNRDVTFDDRGFLKLLGAVVLTTP